MGKDRSQFNYGLPGGRAYYRGKDAYASQSRENESRVVQQPGYMKAVLQASTAYATGTNTVKWSLTTLSNFTAALLTLGWGYTESTGVFTCLRAGRYGIKSYVSISDSANTEVFTLQLRIVRNLNNVPFTYLLTVNTTASGANTSLSLDDVFDFQTSDQVSLEFVNAGGGNRTLAGLSGAGTATETQNGGTLSLLQID